MIYADPTELRDATVVPDHLIKIARSMPGLEALTGADFVLTSTELTGITTKIEQIVLKTNSSLIQRKSGADLLGSMHDLPEIQARMQEWDPSPWLVVTRISAGPKDTVKISGTRRTNKWRWTSVSGALDAWQDRGGCVKVLPDDFDLTWWIQARENRVKQWDRSPEKLVTHVPKFSKQKLRRIDPGWYNTRLAWPKGIGNSQLESLARHIVADGRPPTLANAVALACSNEVLKIKGWGKVSMNSMRVWWGVTTSVLALKDGSPSFCMIYDYHEGVLTMEDGVLMRTERREL